VRPALWEDWGLTSEAARPILWHGTAIPRAPLTGFVVGYSRSDGSRADFAIQPTLFSARYDGFEARPSLFVVRYIDSETA